MKIIRVSQIKTEIPHTEEDVIRNACRRLGIKNRDVQRYEIRRESLDARKKGHLQYVYTVDLYLDSAARISIMDSFSQEVSEEPYQIPEHGNLPLQQRPVIAGAGPAGLFCAYLLAREGYRPLLLERGKTVEEREADVENFWKTGLLNPDSNVQFGEGGAGTFSDGKLNTGVKDRFGRKQFVMETFVRCGAPADILYSSRPHIGTDLLIHVVAALRGEILKYGGEIRYSSCVKDICVNNQELTGLTVQTPGGDEEIPCGTFILACGHSARDTFRMLNLHGVPMEPKAFAVGLRVEHPQPMIDRSQYGKTEAGLQLPPADYRLTYRSKSGRSVYSFCMCPGGHVVNASSEEGLLAVNGMSLRARDSGNANCAVVVSVTPQDFGAGSALSGVEFQRKLEKVAFKAGNGKIPQQLLSDFEAERASRNYGKFMSCSRGGTSLANLRGILPRETEAAFLEGMHAFSRKIRGFDRPDAILSAVESRTSSPVRILRGEDFQSTVKGLYPCGEGAGYSGGIMSSAMDGMKTAEQIIQKYRPFPS